MFYCVPGQWAEGFFARVWSGGENAGNLICLGDFFSISVMAWVILVILGYRCLS